MIALGDPVEEILRELGRAPPLDPEPQPVPEEFAELRLIRKLGEGGMGVVYVAHDLDLDRLVAVKLLGERRASQADRRRFLAEARALARLRHPNVVDVYRVGEVAGRPFFVAELLRGRAWDDLPRPAPVELVAELALGAARGLAAAHLAGIIHRDVKPSNLFRTDGGEVKLLDFGLAKLWSDDDGVGRPAGAPTLQTSAGALLGTPLFLAPERWLGAPATAASDIYALGASLFLLLAGRLPHTAGTRASLAARVLRRPTQPVRELRPETPAPLAAIVDRCLAREPGDRFASGDELRQALEELVRARRHRALPTGDPYPGLLAFQDDQSGLFFGREREIDDLVERLRGGAPVLVTGSSGAGKSSLVRAGVLPRVRAGALEDGTTPWTTITVTPGARPAAALQRACADLPAGLERVVVFIDQLEELVHLAAPDERDRFTAALAALAAHSARIICTGRSDFLGELPGWLTRSVYVLEPLSEDGVRRAVCAPAAAHGVGFEDPADVDAMVGEVAHRRGSLPALAFALARLWQERDRARRLVPAGALARIGGVAGALAAHAERTISALSDARRALVPELFRRLYGRARTRVRRTRDELVSGLPAEAGGALDALVGARLLGADRGRVEIAHESLAQSWPRLAGWLDERDALGAAAERLQAEAAARRARRRRLLALTSVAALIAAALLGFALWNRAVQARTALADVERGRLLLELARAGETVTDALRRAALRAYDEGGEEAGLALWRGAAPIAAAVEDVGESVLLAASEALGIVAGHAPAKRLAAELYADRLREAEARLGRDALVDARRLRFYDDDRRFAGLLAGGARLEIVTRPAGARVELFRADGDRLSPVAWPAAELSPGAYVAEISAPGLATARASFRLERLEQERVEVTLLPAPLVPDGFAYVPAGPAIVGSLEPDMIESARVRPRHEVFVPGFFMAKHEVTIGEWSAYLAALPAARRRELLSASASLLVETADGIALVTPDGPLAPGRPFLHPPGRRGPLAVPADWRRWPITFVSATMADEYAAWLARTGRVPGARLCREDEWEKGARGGDGRLFAGGAALGPADASQRATYGELQGNVRGVDEVGRFPRSRSLYGIDDTAGNVWEWTADASAGRRVLKSGSWRSNSRTLRAEYRYYNAPSHRGDDHGFRLCASLTPSAR